MQIKSRLSIGIRYSLSQAVLQQLNEVNILIKLNLRTAYYLISTNERVWKMATNESAATGHLSSI